jgi:enoyl-CoA hydratase/carnithine racemase
MTGGDGATAESGAAASPAADDTAPLLVQTPAPGILQLTLNAPRARNALSLAMLDALDNAIAVLRYDPDVKVVVVAANGPAYCAGHDLKELTSHRTDPDGGRAFYVRTMAACSRLMQSLMECPKPVIAAVHATATAAGCQLVATADLAVAADTAQFCTPGVNIGLFCSTPMVALSRDVPRKRAMEMLLLGEMISAVDAERYGLVNRVVPADKVLAEALAMAGILAAKSQATLAIGKRAFYEQIEKPVADAYDYATRVMVENMMAADAEEGIGAFLEKRPPQWTCG